MVKWPPRQLLTELIRVERESPSTVAIVSRADVKLTTDRRSLTTSGTLFFDNEVIISAHGVFAAHC